MRKGNRTVMTMSNNYQGPPENFAMVVPVPVVLQKENVKTLPADVFDRVDSLSAPRLVEYWEQDPCAPPRCTSDMAARRHRRWRRRRRRWAKRHRASDLGVTIEAQFVAGEYEILILSATRLVGLETWLRQREVQHPAGRGRGAGALRPRQVEVLRRQGRHQEGQARRAGRRAAVAAAVLVRRQRAAPAGAPRPANAGGKQDLIVYVIHPTSRFEVANYAEHLHPDQPRGRRRRAQQLPGVLRRAVRRHGREDGPQGRRHRVRLADDRLRSLPDAAAVAAGSRDAGPRRARGRRRSRSPPLYARRRGC